MGARAALLHAIENPQSWDGLILVSPNPGIEGGYDRQARRQADNALAASIRRNGVFAFLEFWQQTPMIRSQQNIRPERRKQMDANRMQHEAIGLAQSLELFGQGSCPNLWPQLTKLTMPILLITGEQDTKYTEIAERMTKSLPQAQHQVIAEAGHCPHLEKPEATLAIIEPFIRSF